MNPPFQMYEVHNNKLGSDGGEKSGIRPVINLKLDVPFTGNGYLKLHML